MVRRRPLYSRSSKARSDSASLAQLSALKSAETVSFAPAEASEIGLWQIIAPRLRRFRDRHGTSLTIVASTVVTLLVIGIVWLLLPPAQHLTQSDITAAVGYTLDHRPVPPAESTLAYATVIPSVVRVNGYDPATGEATDSPPAGAQPKEPGKPDAAPPATPGAENPAEALPEEAFTAVGTGVVIDDQGTILTNLHVANAAKHLRVTFWNGMESDASIIGARPEHDLAIIRPKTIPDDLQPATLASSQGLHPGDHVVAIGFPFGIGPSASAGIISGLNRVFEREDSLKLDDLIQFDAAANPGNSGGPLIDAEGDVVGIVTAILNPSGSRTFAGIGFAIPIEEAASAVGESPF